MTSAEGGSRRRPGAGGERIRILLGIAISVVALSGCIWWGLDQPAPEFPTSSRALALLGGALALYAVSMLLRGFRWSAILRRAGIRTSRGEPFALIAVGYMGNTVLPLRGGEALRVVLLRERAEGVTWPVAIGAIVPERLLDVATLIVLFATLVLTGTVETPGGSAPAASAVAGLLLAIAAVIAYRRLRRAGRLAGLAERIRPFAQASRALLTPAGLWLGALSMCIWTLDGTVFWLISEALELGIDPLEAIGLAVAATAFSTIPAGPAFAGTYDVALLFSLEALDVTSSAALAYILLLRFMIFVPITAVGLVLVITRYGGVTRLWRRLRRGRPGAEPGDLASPAPARPAEAGSTR